MCKVVWISDFSAAEVQGGAEIVDHHLMSLLTEAGHSVVFSSSRSTTDLFIKSMADECIFIVSNFVGLSARLQTLLGSTTYFIVEHDHKYLRSRDPSPYKDLRAPKEEIINRDFYKKAQKVFCQSTKHGEVVQNNLQLDNIIAFGSTFWSKEHFDILRDNIKGKKNGKKAVLKTHNLVKGQMAAEAHCHKHKLEFDLVADPDYASFIKKLAQYSGLVFFPQVFETFSRLAVEARILDCELTCNKNISAAYEPWFKLKGTPLLEVVRKTQEEAEKLFLNTIDETTKIKASQADITVILNMYRRPENIPMQVGAIKKQTVQPKQTWVWVNSHEDNKDFDRSTLNVDRIFDNDFNWKFYGRFAAALLADTEYIAIFDDDTVPGNQWFKNCLETMETHEGILGSAGVILKSPYYVQHDRCGWPTQNEETTEVDLVGHAWFFKREWLSHLWSEKPTTWDNGEDIQFSFLAQQKGGIKTYCPPHPTGDKSLHGSVLGNELGIDSKATSNNNETSHQQFFSERDGVVHNALQNGWKTVKGIKL
jgi:hypothetical protein